MMRLFYFADSYARRGGAQDDCRRIEAGTKGWMCNARWLSGNRPLPPETWARVDVEDLREASAVIIGHGRSTQGGKWVELGLAIAWGKPICMIFPTGPLWAGATEPPVFAYPKEFTHWVVNPEEAMQWLGDLR